MWTHVGFECVCVVCETGVHVPAPVVGSQGMLRGVTLAILCSREDRTTFQDRAALCVFVRVFVCV